MYVNDPGMIRSHLTSLIQYHKKSQNRMLMTIQLTIIIQNHDFGTKP